MNTADKTMVKSVPVGGIEKAQGCEYKPQAQIERVADVPIRSIGHDVAGLHLTVLDGGGPEPRRFPRRADRRQWRQ